MSQPIKITIVEANHLKKRKFFKVHPYCVLKSSHSKISYKTAIKLNTCNPYWGEEFIIIMNPLFDALLIFVYDFHRYKEDTCIGVATINIKELSLLVEQTYQADLKNLNYQNKIVGYLTVKLFSFTNSMEKPVRFKWDQELMNSLCTNESSSKEKPVKHVLCCSSEIISYSKMEILHVYLFSSNNILENQNVPLSLLQEKILQLQFLSDALEKHENSKLILNPIETFQKHSEKFYEVNNILQELDLDDNLQKIDSSFYQKYYERINFVENNQNNDENENNSYFYISEYLNKISRFQNESIIDEYSRVDISISRNNIFEDSFKKIMKKSEDELKKKLTISFKNEEGVDCSGVTREWFYLLSQEIFNPNYGLFHYYPNESHVISINPNSFVNSNHLQYFEFVGRVIGLALLHQNHINVSFIHTIYSLILNIPIQFEDIRLVDRNYYKSLCWILENDINGVLNYYFTVSVDQYDKVEDIELIPKGKEIAVNNENKFEYVRKLILFRYSGCISEQIESLKIGFFSILPSFLLSGFGPKELKLLISGVNTIDVEDWKRNTEFGNGFCSNHPCVKMFWDVVNEFTDEEKSKLLQFVTGTNIVPITGFKDLIGNNSPQRFCLSRIENTNGLCKAQTCFNLLKLPEYSTIEIMRERLLFAINNTEGFALE